MVSYRGVIALCLMMVGLLTSIPLYNGTTLGDLVFQLADLSDWPKKARILAQFAAWFCF